jgi:oligopeptide/dipeptide ABC transporter ATP-binding protein
MPPFLNIEGLSVFLGRPGESTPVVDDVSLAVSEGEALALVGESGCGKTTTALATLHLLPSGMSLRGSVRLGGRELTRLTESEMRRVRGKELAMVFQDPAAALDPVYRVGEQIAEGLRWHERLGRQAAWARAVASLGEVGLPQPDSWARAYPHQLSGGMRQRALIATAIACGPRALIADEPTAALDLTLRRQVIALLNRLRAERRLALLIISHDLTAVAAMTDRVTVMFAGQVVEQTDTRTFFAGPAHPYSRALLAAATQLEECVARAASATLPRKPAPLGCRYAPNCPQAVAECDQPQQLLELQPGHSVRCGQATRAGG